MNLNLGEVIITTKVEQRSDTSSRPGLKVSYGVQKGYHMVLLNLGSLPFGNSDEALMSIVKHRMLALGWVPADNKAALEAALAKLKGE